jgi:hypothetical protein
MSSKRKTPKKKSKEEDILFQAVHQMVKTKKPKSKTPRRKTPKQKGGQEDNFLNKIQNMLFSMNHTEFNGIGIDTTFIPLDGNKNNIERMFTEVTQNTVSTSKSMPTVKGKQIGGNNKAFRVIESYTEEDEEEEIQKGGYGKKYINNNVRLYEGPNANHHLFHPI